MEKQLEKILVKLDDLIVGQTKIETRLDYIEVDLREHKEGVIQNRKTLVEHKEFLGELHRGSPKILFGKTKKIGAWLVTVSAAIIAVIKLKGLF